MGGTQVHASRRQPGPRPSVSSSPVTSYQSPLHNIPMLQLRLLRRRPSRHLRPHGQRDPHGHHRVVVRPVRRCRRTIRTPHKRLALLQQPRAVEQERSRRQHRARFCSIRGRDAADVSHPASPFWWYTAHQRRSSPGAPALHGRDCSVPPPPTPGCTAAPVSPLAPPAPAGVMWPRNSAHCMPDDRSITCAHE